jgi:uncharacterized protein Usg
MVNGEVMGTGMSAATLPRAAGKARRHGFRLAMVVAGNGNLSPTRTEDEMVSEDFRKQVSGYGLTTAHILYRRPDHRWLLQSYVWQNYDLFPEFPELHRFLAFWKEKLEGPLHSVRVAHCKLIKPAELRAINREFRLH